MKRLMLDHFRRWWWVLALSGALEFLLGGYVVNHPGQPYEFGPLCSRFGAERLISRLICGAASFGP